MGRVLEYWELAESNFMKTSMTLPIATEGLHTYLQQVNGFALLSAEEEVALASRYREHNDLAAAQQLVLPHLRYVVSIARGYTGYGLPLADLIQEGTIGLMKAVKRFDPTIGVRLVSYAVHWIKSEIHEYVIRNWRIVKVATTKAQRKLFFNLRSAKKRLGWFSAQEIQTVASDLGVSPEEVLQMEQRLNAHDASFDMPPDSSEVAHYAPIWHLSAPRSQEPTHLLDTKENNQTQETLQAALAQLDPRSKDIVAQRWLDEEKTSFKTLAEKYGISIERVRQLEKSAFEKIKKSLKAFASV